VDGLFHSTIALVAPIWCNAIIEYIKLQYYQLLVVSGLHLGSWWVQWISAR